jgi:hypothetical protein
MPPLSNEAENSWESQLAGLPVGVGYTETASEFVASLRYRRDRPQVLKYFWEHLTRQIRSWERARERERLMYLKVRPHLTGHVINPSTQALMENVARRPEHRRPEWEGFEIDQPGRQGRMLVEVREVRQVTQNRGNKYSGRKLDIAQSGLITEGSPKNLEQVACARFTRRLMISGSGLAT